MNLHVLPAGPIQTNAYLLSAPERGEAVLIDAPKAVWEEVASLLAGQKCRLVELWLTHGHWDHMQGAAEVVRESGVKVRAHPADRALLETPEDMRRFTEERLQFPIGPLEAVTIDHWLKHGETLDALGAQAEVRHVPGHCPGNVLFHFAALHAAFVGDTLFRGGIGRTDLPGGNGPELQRSIREQIYTLPPETVVLPGHGPGTTVRDEREHNPYVSG